MSTTMKTCSVCGLSKEKSIHFYPQGGVCKSCYQARQRAIHHKNAPPRNFVMECPFADGRVKRSVDSLTSEELAWVG